jgi:hypothetical protein
LMKFVIATCAEMKFNGGKIFFNKLAI